MINSEICTTNFYIRLRYDFYNSSQHRTFYHYRVDYFSDSWQLKLSSMNFRNRSLLPYDIFRVIYLNGFIRWKDCSATFVYMFRTCENIFADVGDTDSWGYQEHTWFNLWKSLNFQISFNILLTSCHYPGIFRFGVRSWRNFCYFPWYFKTILLVPSSDVSEYP